MVPNPRSADVQELIKQRSGIESKVRPLASIVEKLQWGYEDLHSEVLQGIGTRGFQRDLRSLVLLADQFRSQLLSLDKGESVLDRDAVNEFRSVARLRRKALAERASTIRVSRLIDLIEAAIKVDAIALLVIASQLGLERSIGRRQGTSDRRPVNLSIGDWVRSSRGIRRELVADRSDVQVLLGVDTVGVLRERSAEITSAMDRFTSLRNEYRGHGLTPSDSRAEHVARELIDIWKSVVLGMAYLERCKFFRLDEVRRRRTSIDVVTTPLVGSSEELVSEVVSCSESSPLITKNTDEIYIESLSSGSILPVWPLLICDEKQSRSGEVWVLDGMSSDEIIYRRLGRESEPSSSKRVERLGADSAVVTILRSVIGK